MDPRPKNSSNLDPHTTGLSVIDLGIENSKISTTVEQKKTKDFLF